MAKVVMYATGYCPYCVRAEQLLRSKNVAVEKIMIDSDPAQTEVMLQRSGGRRTVPQIFIDDYHVGGCDDLYALDRAKKLEPLLAK